MSVAKVIELSATSEDSFEDAIQQGISRAAETINDITGAWVQDHSVRVNDGQITEYKVTLKVTFIVNESSKQKGQSR